jgi:hypothetical protein
MPTRNDANALSAVACIILPALVKRKNAAKATMNAIAAPNTMSCCGRIGMPHTNIGAGSTIALMLVYSPLPPHT